MGFKISGCSLLSAFVPFFLIFLPLSRAGVSPKAPVVSRISILVHDLSPDADLLRQLARRLLHVKAGAPFSLEALEKSIKALKRSNLFKRIHVPDPVEREGKVALVFELTPFLLIKKIEIKGAFPLLEEDVLNKMHLRVGDPFDPKATGVIKRDIENLFKENGYIRPEAAIIAKQDEKDGRMGLTVSIHKGKYYRIRQVLLEGNRFFPDITLLTPLKTWQASRLFWGMSRFVQADLKKDVKRLIRLYRREGFADVKIAPVLEKDPDSGRMAIRFRIREGPRYEIAFSGNKAFSDAVLLQALPLFTRGNQGDLALKRGIHRLTTRYRKAGFSRVHISVDDKIVEKDSGPVRSLRILIEEGPRFLMRSLRIQGNRFIEKDKIKEKILSRPSTFGKATGFFTGTWEEDKRAVKRLYLRNGFMDVQVTDALAFETDPKTKNQWVDAVLSIQEGPRTLVGEVAFEGLSVFTEKEALQALSLKPGAPYRRYRLPADRELLKALISEKGHPYVTVSEKATVRKSPRVADIVYVIDEGPEVRVGNLFVRGNFRTKKGVITKKMKIQKGALFSLKSVLAATRRVSRIEALDNVRLQLIGFREKKARVDVVVNVNERKPYLFELGLGYDTVREAYLLGRLKDKNLLGLNKSIWIDGEYSRIGYKAEAGVTDPDFLQRGISATGTLFAQKEEQKNRAFGIRSQGATVRFQRRLSDRIDGGLAFRYESRKQVRLNEVPVLPEEQEEYEPRTLFVLTPSVHWISVDSLVRPKKGFIGRALVDVSKGLDNTLDDFIRYRLEARYYRSPLKGLTLAFRARWGVIQSYSPDDNVADDQLFYLGGLGDVRGFEENKLRTDASGNAVGGRMELLGNMEVRYDLGSRLEALVFLDMGAVLDAKTDAGEEGLRSSVGIGLNYITPVGPVSLMYGHKLDRKAGEGAGRVHFSIGYTF